MHTGSSILVTGGAGFVGSHIVLELLDAGHRVIIADNLSTGAAQLGAATGALSGHRPSCALCLGRLNEEGTRKKRRPLSSLDCGAGINGQSAWLLRQQSGRHVGVVAGDAAGRGSTTGLFLDCGGLSCQWQRPNP